MGNMFSYPFFRIDRFGGFIALAIAVFFILTLVYSFRFMKGRPRLIQYYSYIILTAVAAMAAALSNNLILLLVFWEFLGLTLFLLINMGGEGAAKAARKSLLIVGGSDALMILGVALIYLKTGTVQMDMISLAVGSGMLTVIAYICIAIACLAKAGAIPFHSWIPDCAQSAPVPVAAYLPASLDKLLGIYLLVRLSLDLFVMNTAMNAALMLAGALTIIAAVMMAMVQHNIKKLLGYHAVSQVGYMILGIGTGNPVGIAGGLFHMLNNAVYKSCLFFSAGNVEYRARTTELDKLGGLAKFMPFTYVSFLIASLSISGVPPFNGFMSKWLIYQGIIQKFQVPCSRFQVLIAAFCLIAAMFGSALTLASFMKLLHSVFLGQGGITPHPGPLPMGEGIKGEGAEVSRTMWIPPAILAAFCVLFGVFAFSAPLKYFIFPVVSHYHPIDPANLSGIWSPGTATLLIIAGLVFGFIVFKAGALKAFVRRDAAFVGAELSQPSEANRVTGIEFYNTIREIRILNRLYKKAEQGAFDIYEQAKKAFSVSRFLQYLHNGVLPSYLVWTLLGMLGLFVMFIR